MTALGRRAAVSILILILATGVALRLWNLPSQILGEDELHSVHSALANPISTILVTYQRLDNTIPLTALFRFLMEHGTKLTEMIVRAPAVLSGLALLLLAPWWVARRLGWGTGMVFAALLAISPGLVFYGRIARSYAPIVLFGFGALVVFEAWWRQPDNWRWGAAYVFLAALAAWFHLGAAPFVVSPFLFAAGYMLVRRDFRRLRTVVILGLATVAAFLAFLIPARETLLALLKEKHGELKLTKRLALGVLELHTGSGQTWLVVLFWVAAIVGLVRLFRLDRYLAALSLIAVLGDLAAILYLAPEGYEQPLISFRYLLMGLPWVLLWVAAGVGRPFPLKKGKKWAGGTMSKRLSASAAVLLPIVLALTGPFVHGRLWRSPFDHFYEFTTVVSPRLEMPPNQVPNFYRELATLEDPGAVLEYPWVPAWRMNRALYLYQKIHRRDVVVAPARGGLADRRLAFRNMVPGTPEGFLSSRARWLVVHRNLVLEEINILPRRKERWRLYDLFPTSARRTIGRLTRAWGKPYRSDGWVAVWDLARARTKR